MEEEALTNRFSGFTLADEEGNHHGEEEGSHAQQRPRATWAEVASSGIDGGEQDSSQVESVQEYCEAQSVGGDGGWETVGNRRREKHSRYKFPQQVHVDNWNGYKRVAHEQQYLEEADFGCDLEPKEEELSDISEACNKLWELDFNRLEPQRDYVIDFGEGKRMHEQEDMAQEKLFSWLSDDVFNRPTFSRFCSLLDNYDPDQNVEEVLTREEKYEQEAFIEEISRTAPLKYLHRYLVAKNIVSDNYEEFKEMVAHLWFDLYKRSGGTRCSSAFEHVFVGEIKNKREEEVSGLHNWIQFYLEEASERIDYQGYIFPRKRCEAPDSETQLLTVQFEWNGILKKLSSTFIGVSPEFEIALYTLCFFIGEEDNYVNVGPYSVNIKCYRLGEHKIGSIYPIAQNC